MDELLQVLRCVAVGVLWLVFAQAAWHKLADMTRFAASLAAYRLLPRAVVPVAARGLLVAELVTLALLLLQPPLGAWGALTLLSLYTGALAIVFAQGRREVDCGCGDKPTPVSGGVLLRNTVLVLFALAASMGAGWPVHLPVVGWGLAIAATAAAALAYLAVEQLLANAAVSPRRAGRGAP